MTTPRATYRLQLHPGFGFDDAAARVPYLARLGISHLYTSPILQAVAGSSHGYDVVDHGRVNAELGGEAGFDRLVAAAHEAKMALVVDVVPNHMAIGPANAWWWDVLRYGRASRHAGYFDVDWDPPGSRLRDVILLPVLADQYRRVLASGGIRLERRGLDLEVVTGEQRFPLDPASLQALLADAAADRLDPGTALDRAAQAVNADPDRLHALLEVQHYRLAHRRASSSAIGYRRFFDVDGLVGLRVEDSEVFEATHRLILERVAAGQIAGLRVDHPDGLRDPAGYFERLRAAAPSAWIVAEKILERSELLPDWPVDGTTGYRFANLATGLLVDPDAEPMLTDAYHRFTDAEPAWEPVAADSRKLALTGLLGSDLNRLTELFVEVCRERARFRDATRHELHEALRELAAAYPVYRTYVRPDDTGVAERDRRVVEEATAVASARRPDLDPELIAFLGSILLLEVRGRPATELAPRFQQLTPAAMAKGIEDTAFYRYLRLLALNEVGGDPGRFGLAPSAFHAAMAREQERWPRAMLATSTHDTKRSDDVRARLAVLSELPEAWEEAVRRLARRVAPHRTADDLPGAAAEYLFFQTLVGAWPIDVERAGAYMEKATREAKLRTSWTHPDSAFEASVQRLVRGSLSDSGFVAEVERTVAPLVERGRVNALAQTLWKLTAPGVPDIYQGGELWDLSLVDPDNRRPVDFKVRRRLLEEADELQVADVLRRSDDGLTKLWLIQRALALRERRPGDLGPHGSYRPLSAVGPAAEHVVAYLRGNGVLAVAPRLSVRLSATGGWRGTSLPVPSGRWRNVLADRAVAGPQLDLAGLLEPFPVALLERVA